VRYSKNKVVNILSVLILLLSFAYAANASEETTEQKFEDAPEEVLMTVRGVVNENYEIEGDDGSIYEIDFSEGGDELIHMTGESVSATGIVSKVEGFNAIIRVNSFEVMTK
jgi:hypothetical protein